MKKIQDNEKVDFVILWVDGNDKKWVKEKSKYLNLKGDMGENRFRDCDNLQYLFRGIDQYADWVNKVFFITWGHLPKWLNTKNPKLRVVRHEEFIPEEYLPTFNSNVIELNLHRIKDLSEKFVLFNDDLFILKNTKKEDFFKNDLPVDLYCEYMHLASEYNDTFYFMRSNNLAIINNNFNKREFMKKHFFKVINPKYKKLNFITINSIRAKKRFSGFYDFHVSQPYLKDTYRRVWEKEGDKLDIACRNKFRASTDIGNHLCRYWQLVEGKFVPKSDSTKYLVYKNDNKETIDIILNRKYQQICINDADMSIDFEKAKREINKALNKILPEKSQFEK